MDSTIVVAYGTLKQLLDACGLARHVLSLPTPTRMQADAGRGHEDPGYLMVETPSCDHSRTLDLNIF